MFLLIALALIHPSSRPLTQSVDVERADGTRAKAELTSIEPADFGPAGIVSVRFDHPFWPRSETADERALCELTLVGGDRLGGLVRGGVGETLEVELAGGVALPISIEELDRIVFPGRLPSGRALEHAEIGDRLYVLRGAELDRVDGTFEAFGADGVTFDGRELGSKRFAWEEVAALFVEALGDGGAPPDVAAGSVPVAVDLTDGSRLRGALTELGSSACTLELFGRELDLPLELVRELWLDDGTVAFLSDLQPVAARPGSIFGDEFGMSWPHRMDRAVSGGPLSAAGRTYLRGIGVHAGSRLRFELDGSWSTLRGSVAVDDSVLRLPAGAEASVEFRIWLDRDPDAEPGSPDEREPDWRSGTLRAGQIPLAIEGLDLSGVRALTLAVDAAENLSVGDRANWLRMLLVRG